MGDANTTETAARLDVWLDVACLFKTRSEAQKAVQQFNEDINSFNACLDLEMTAYERSGQFDDLEGPGYRILDDDDTQPVLDLDQGPRRHGK